MSPSLHSNPWTLDPLTPVFVIKGSPAIRENHPPLEIKGTSTVLPGHAEALLSWKKLAGERAVGGLIVADLDRSFSFKGLRAIPWWEGPE